MPRVFISYRRTDSADAAGRMFDRLLGAFGAANVFKDVDSIPLGAEFTQVINHRLSSCDAVIVVIGKTWLSVPNREGTPRIFDAADLVRIEVEQALNTGLLVIPALVGDTPMPSADQLPLPLRRLVMRNAIWIRSDPDFHRDMDRLIGAVQEHIKNNPIPVTAVLVKPAAVTPIVVTVVPDETPPKPARERRRSDERRDEEAVRRCPVVRSTPARGGMGAGCILTFVLGLVACVIVASVAIALLVPGTLNVREAAERAESSNHLKQIGLACHSFHDANRRLPFNGSDMELQFGGVQKYRRVAAPGSPTSGSWAFQILPYIEQQAVFQGVNRNAPIPTYLCPGRHRPIVESSMGGGGAWTDYFLNNYINDPQQADRPDNPDHHRALWNIADGTSNTILVGHGNISTAQYNSAGNVAMSSNIFMGGTGGTTRAGNGALDHPSGVFLLRDSGNLPGIGNWGGPFLQGGLMCMADASVRTIPYTTSNFSAFLTPAGNEPVILPE